MTGKRSMMAISVVVPLLLKLINDKISRKGITKDVFIVALFSMLFLIVDFIDLSFLESIPGFHRIFSTLSDVNNGISTSSSRDFLWASALNVFHSSPVIGVGVGRFMQVSGSDMDAHNAYLQILAEQGIVGLLLFIIPLVYCVINTIKQMYYRKNESCETLYFSLFIQFVLILYSITGNPMVNPYGYMIYFLAISILSNNNSFLWRIKK